MLTPEWSASPTSLHTHTHTHRDVLAPRMRLIFILTSSYHYITENEKKLQRSGVLYFISLTQI